MEISAIIMLAAMVVTLAVLPNKIRGPETILDKTSVPDGKAVVPVNSDDDDI